MDPSLIEQQQQISELIESNLSYAWRLDFSLHQAPMEFSITDEHYRQGLTMIAVPGFLLATIALIIGIATCCVVRNRRYKRRSLCRRFTIIAFLLSLVAISFCIVLILFSQNTDANVDKAHAIIQNFVTKSSQQLQAASGLVNALGASPQLFTGIVDNALEKLIQVADQVRDGNRIRSIFSYFVFGLAIVAMIMSPLSMRRNSTDKVPLSSLGMILSGAASIFAFLHFATVVAICDACLASEPLLQSQASTTAWLVCPAVDTGISVLEPVIQSERNRECALNPQSRTCLALSSAVGLVSNNFQGCRDFLKNVQDVHHVVCWDLIRSLDQVVISALAVSVTLILWVAFALLSGKRLQGATEEHSWIGGGELQSIEFSPPSDFDKDARKFSSSAPMFSRSTLPDERLSPFPVNVHNNTAFPSARKPTTNNSIAPRSMFASKARSHRLPSQEHPRRLGTAQFSRSLKPAATPTTRSSSRWW